MYHVGICDDGINICSYIEKCLLQIAAHKHIEIETEVWYSGESLWNFLENGNHVDVLFLDIELITMTGIDVGEKIRSQLEDWSIQIIYISGKPNYAHSLFKTQPMDFLVKPIEKERVETAFLTAMKIIDKEVERFGFRNGRDNYYIPYKNILYFTRLGRKIQIITCDTEKEFTGQLKDIAEKLPNYFLFIHQSYIVNRMYIRQFTYEWVELENGVKLSISKSYRKQVRQQLLEEE